jgi:hypothetical protein
LRPGDLDGLGAGESDVAAQHLEAGHAVDRAPAGLEHRRADALKCIVRAGGNDHAVRRNRQAGGENRFKITRVGVATKRIDIDLELAQHARAKCASLIRIQAQVDWPWRRAADVSPAAA